MAKLSALMETFLISHYNHSWMTQSGSTITQSWLGPKLCRAVKEMYASEVSVEYATHTWEEGRRDNGSHSKELHVTCIIFTSSFPRFASSAYSPSFAYVSNPATAHRFSRLRPLQLLPDCVPFGCCSPIASASAAAPQLSPLQLLLPDYVCFNCCSLIASTRLLLPDCIRLYIAPAPCPMFSNILCGVLN